jgi:hypothetical protein
MSHKSSDYYVTIPLPLLDAPGAALKVYAILRSYLNPAEPERNEAWPKRRTIATRASVSIDTVDRAITWLVENGWIVVEERVNEDGAQTSNRYIIFGTARLGSRTDAAGGGRKDAEGGAAKPVHEVEPPELEPTPPSDGWTPPPSVLEFALLPPQSKPATKAQQFDEFWTVYPRKVGKKAAKAAYLRATKDTGHRTIVAAVLHQIEHGWKDPRYIPHPTTWLNQGRWDDEAETTRRVVTDLDLPDWTTFDRPIDYKAAYEALEANDSPLEGDHHV